MRDDYEGLPLNSMTVTSIERYVGPAQVARHLGVTRAVVSVWWTRGVEVPKPDGLMEYRDGEFGPMWLEGRLPEWSTWWFERSIAPANARAERAEEVAVTARARAARLARDLGGES